MVIPTPPSDSEFSWNCSTGCFADMKMKQTVNVTELEIVDSGVITCSVIINDDEYFSESFELRIFSKWSMIVVHIHTYVSSVSLSAVVLNSRD